jgi:cytoskeletal protein CcmA (bactofilin family)
MPKFMKQPLLILFFALTLHAHAVEFLSTNVYRVAAGQTIADEQWVTAGSAETEGLFKNDLFISCGGILALNGTYEGNIWGAAGGEASLEGQCERNVRLAGKSVRIDGTIDGNAMVMAETIIATTNAVIGGNATLLGTSIILEGTIKGRATITAARVATLGGTLEHNVTVTAPDILFSRETTIGGDLSYSTNKELLPADGVVGGQLRRIVPQNPPLFSAERLASRAMWLMAALLAGIPFIALFPMTTAMASQLAKKAPWKCLLAGFLASGVLPIIALMCISSIIGIPLGVMAMASWGMMLYLSRIIVGLVLGTSILRTGGSSISRILLAMALGLAIIYLVTMIPAIGIPVQIAVVWMGMGALILAQLQKRRLIIQVPDELKQLEKLKQQNNQKEETS